MLKIDIKATGENIIKIAKSKNITHRIIADELGLNRTTPYQWERGRCLPEAETMLNISKMLDCPIEELLVYTEEDADEGAEDTQADNIE